MSDKDIIFRLFPWIYGRWCYKMGGWL